MNRNYPINNKIKWVLWIVVTIGLIGIPIGGYDIKGFPMQMTGNEWMHLPFLESRYLYFIHHLFAVVPVFFFGIVLNMYSYRDVFVKTYLPGILLMGGLFIIWDILFTQYEIWSFDKRYVLGFFLLKVPLEEYLWFFVIPFCGMFVYHICEYHFKLDDSKDDFLKSLVFLLVVVLYYIGVDKLYTAESLAFCASVVLFGILWRVPQFGLFVSSFGFILIPMFLFNGMLTGMFTKQALVVYNWQEFSNFRVLSYPVEDIAYGFAILYGIHCLNYFLKVRLSGTYKETK